MHWLCSQGASYQATLALASSGPSPPEMRTGVVDQSRKLRLWGMVHLSSQPPNSAGPPDDIPSGSSSRVQELCRADVQFEARGYKMEFLAWRRL